MKHPLVGIIADDLTGAMDTAAPFAARGLSTRVVLSAGAAGHAPGSTAEILAVNTSSTRTLGPKQAASAVTRAIGRLGKTTPTLWFKKIDSTLRGNVAAETLAALQATGLRHAIVAPAVPAFGRAMRRGKLFVYDLPLARTPFGHGAQALHGSLAAAFRGARRGVTLHMVGNSEEPALADAPGVHVYLCDCEGPEDLIRIARFVRAHAAEALPVGASGLAEAFAGIIAGPAIALSPPCLGRGPILFVVGSQASQSVAQAKGLVESGAAQITISDPDASMGLRALATHTRACPSGNVAVLVQWKPAPSDPAQRRLRSHVITLMHERIPKAVVLTGGDTARAVLRALRVDAIEVHGLLLPGIALGSICYDNRRLFVITKAGGFGDERTFLTIANRLGRKEKAHCTARGIS